jgi:hypothetical protein
LLAWCNVSLVCIGRERSARIGRLLLNDSNRITEGHAASDNGSAFLLLFI